MSNNRVSDAENREERMSETGGSMRSASLVDEHLKERMSASSAGSVRSDAHLKDGPREDREGCCAPEKSILVAALKLISVFISGIIFGFALEKSRVFEPATIRAQMIFRRWIMLKMFLAVMATGQVVLVILYVIPATRAKVRRASDTFACSLHDKGILTTLLGPLLLGAGMPMAGSCPSMILAQVGTWTKNSLFTLLGVLLGALLYGLLAPYIVKVTKPRRPYTFTTVDRSLGWPYPAVAVPLAAAMGVVVFLLEWFVPWNDDLEIQNQNNTTLTSNPFEWRSWPPSFAGLVGSLQLVLVLAVHDTFDGAGSYVTLMSQWVIGARLKYLFPYLAKSRCGISNLWEVCWVGGVMMGCLFSALSSDSVAMVKGATVPVAVCGGMLIIIGTRFGSGCPSRHGLSGLALTFWLSFLAVPMVFAGGISTAFAMQATGALDSYVCFSDTPCGPTA